MKLHGLCVKLTNLTLRSSARDLDLVQLFTVVQRARFVSCLSSVSLL